MDGRSAGCPLCFVIVLARFQLAQIEELFHHGANLLNHEGDGPFEQILAIRQMEWVLNVLELLHIHLVLIDDNNCAHVVILTAVIGGAENSDDGRECRVATPFMHPVSVDLNLVRPNDANEVIGPQDLLDWIVTEFYRALPGWVRTETHLASVTVVHWISPEQIAKEAIQWYLLEAIDLVYVRCSDEFRRDATMHAKVVTVDISGYRHRIESIHEEVEGVRTIKLLHDFSAESEVLCHSS